METSVTQTAEDQHSRELESMKAQISWYEQVRNFFVNGTPQRTYSFVCRTISMPQNGIGSRGESRLWNCIYDCDKLSITLVQSEDGVELSRSVMTVKDSNLVEYYFKFNAIGPYCSATTSKMNLFQDEQPPDLLDCESPEYLRLVKLLEIVYGTTTPWQLNAEEIAKCEDLLPYRQPIDDSKQILQD
jgi:hypothetical protein